ncbi:MAG: SdrD B-like domain-containing protein [Acutalibacteraceae bacterium]
MPADQHYRTNNDGSYRFEGLSPQDGYAVVVCDSDTRAYFSAPTNIVTQDDTKIAIREHLDLSLGGEKSDQNFGLYKPVQITGRAFYDADYDGIYHESTDRLLEGITVTLKGLFDNAEVATATTDENGYYQFDNVVAGQYYVEFGKTTQDGTTYDIETKVPVHTEPNAIANNVTIDGKSDGFAVTGDKDATDFNINIGFINYAHVRTLAWFRQSEPTLG